jgi:hypothetical protein
MAFANALNSELGVVCTHEGKFRHGESPGEQVLPFLTLENRLAYERPTEAAALFDRGRGNLRDLARARGCTHFGDLAYNYAPFVLRIGAHYPAARLLVFVRSGIEFVRSAAQESGVDPAPVGWPPREKPLTAVERFIEFGRLAPRQHDPMAVRWRSFDYVARNAWLWAETNRLIFDAIASRPPGSTLIIRHESFAADPVKEYTLARRLLGLRDELPSRTRDILRTPINRRWAKALGPYASWTTERRTLFDELAGAMMQRLGYSNDEAPAG